MMPIVQATTPNLDELKELNRQLTMLLEDPQPGSA